MLNDKAVYIIKLQALLFSFSFSYLFVLDGVYKCGLFSYIKMSILFKIKIKIFFVIHLLYGIVFSLKYWSEILCDFEAFFNMTPSDLF